MGNWFRRKSSYSSQSQVLDIASEIEIGAQPADVWKVIKPAENALLLDPHTVRAFQVPGTPTGAGEIQCFITRQGGRERVTAIEVLDEVANEYAITRTLGDEDDAARISYFLTPTPEGTRMELRYRFTVTGPGREQTSRWESQYRAEGSALLARIKLVVERMAASKHDTQL